MEIIKNWLKSRKYIIIILLVALVSGYYTYLTHVSRVYYINETYYASDEYSSFILQFDGDTMSAYFINPTPDTIGLRVDYQLNYRTYTKDFLGNYWSNRGIEAFALRGSDVAGRISAECIGCALWSDKLEYYTQEEINNMEDEEGTDYSFISHFSIKDEILHVYNFSPLDFQRQEEIPLVEAEIMRLMDTLCPLESD